MIEQLGMLFVRLHLKKGDARIPGRREWGSKASEREVSIQLDPGEQIYVSARLARISQNSLTFSVLSSFIP